MHENDNELQNKGQLTGNNSSLITLILNRLLILFALLLKEQYLSCKYLKPYTKNCEYSNLNDSRQLKIRTHFYFCHTNLCQTNSK